MEHTREEITFWKDLGQMRKPNSNWECKKAARYVARLLQIPASEVWIGHGERTLAELRKKK